jgi:hypothetical protein
MRTHEAKLAEAGRGKATLTSSQHRMFSGAVVWVHEARYDRFTQTFDDLTQAKRWIMDRHTEWLISTMPHA